MDNIDHYLPNNRNEESVARIGAFAKRRNPLPDDPPENDDMAVVIANSAPLHDRQQETIESAESPIDQHHRLEWAATLRLYRNTKLLLSSLAEVVPRGMLTLVSLIFLG